MVEERSSFLTTRTKRLLFFRSHPVGSHGRNVADGAEAKVFWFFSSEKEHSPFNLLI
jgi:hypothetical protein